MPTRPLTRLLIRAGLLAALLGLTGRTAGAWPAGSPASSHAVYIPLSIREACAPNAQEADIANRMKTDPQQQRASLTCHPILEEVARARAVDMGVRDYFSHVNLDGHGPNFLVQQAGYLLPAWYDQSLTGNNIESIAAGQATTGEVWQAWMSSPGHQTHLLGLDPFWAEQPDYGIGYAFVPNSSFGHYWVVITARPGP